MVVRQRLPSMRVQRPRRHVSLLLILKSNCSCCCNSCIYNKTLDSFPSNPTVGGGSQCIGCRDNTTGNNCESCLPYFYRDPGLFDGAMIVIVCLLDCTQLDSPQCFFSQHMQTLPVRRSWVNVYPLPAGQHLFAPTFNFEYVCL